MFFDRIFYDPTVEEEYYSRMRQKSSSLSAFMVGLVAAVGGFMYGYDTGLINDIMEMNYVSTHFASSHVTFSVHERAIITAILSLGTFFGALLAPFISDNFGRKTSIIISSLVVFNIGNILQIAAKSTPLLCVGRAISGIAVGNLSAIVPLYQAEASPKWVRGSVVFTYQWAITWGLLIASAICQGTRKMNNSASYRIPVGLQFLWALALYIGMLFLPESPRYYVQIGKIPQALDLLSKLRRLPEDDPDLIEELVEIKANYDYELSFGKSSMLDVFRSGGGRHKQVLRICTGTGVHFFQQCSGINFIFYFGTNFFSSTGMKNSYLMSFITYAVNMVFTIPGIILVEVLGRRALLLYGGVGMSVANLIIAIVGVSISQTSVSSIICISFSCVFIACFAASWGGCAWALASDLYGISIRQKAIAVTAATNWLVNFIFAYITPYLVDTGKHTAALGTKIFFIWGGCNALGVVFVYFMVYETQGLKLEEVDYMYVHCKNAFELVNFKRSRAYFERAQQLGLPMTPLPITPQNEPVANGNNNGNENSENEYGSGGTDNYDTSASGSKVSSWEHVTKLINEKLTNDKTSGRSRFTKVFKKDKGKKTTKNKKVNKDHNNREKVDSPNGKSKETNNSETNDGHHSSCSSSLSGSTSGEGRQGHGVGMAVGDNDQDRHSINSSDLEPANDYQKYLSTFYSNTDNLESSMTSASARDFSLNGRMNFKEKDLQNDAALLNPNQKMTIIAAPFLSAPPSDSDSSITDSEHSFN